MRTASPSAKPAPANPWVLTCLDPNLKQPALLWNGEIGVRIGRDGRAAGSMFLIESYQTSGEEKIIPVPCPISVEINQGSNELARDLSRVQNYAQSIDMRTGILTTKWDEPVPTASHPSRHAKVTCETILHPTSRTLGQRWTIVFAGGPGDLDFGAEATGGEEAEQEGRYTARVFRDLDGWKGRWTLRQTTDAEKPRQVQEGEPFVAEAIWTFEAPAISPIEAARSIFLLRHPKESPLAVPDSGGSVPTLFEQLRSQTAATWEERWKTDIEIDGPVEDQQAIRSFLFYLRSGISPNALMSISPFGLSNDQYFGHVFWDADIWVFPALALIDPEAAAAIPKYRLALKDAARRNFVEWMAAGRPTARGKLGIASLSGKVLGYKFPWESSVTGKETVPGPSRFEDHISGSVAWSVEQAATLGLVQAKDAQTLVQGVAGFYAQRQEDGNIRDTMSPDEHHTGDNDLYTNLLAQWCLNGGSWSGTVHTGGQPVDTHARAGRATLKLPRDETSFLTYDNDALKTYKQAAAVLSIYPLQYPEAEKQAKAMMERFADKVIPNGPAMSDSVHALIWARMGETEKAYETWKRSWQDFVKQPHLQFSEKRKRESTYFTTGAGGCLQTVLYGFLGFRIDSKKQDGAAWSTKLALGRILSVKPNLPNTWKSVKLKNFTVLGRRYTLIATHPDPNGKGGVQVIQGDR